VPQTASNPSVKLTVCGVSRASFGSVSVATHTGDGFTDPLLTFRLIVP